jgi:hypothetical protein
MSFFLRRWPQKCGIISNFSICRITVRSQTMLCIIMRQLSFKIKDLYTGLTVRIYFITCIATYRDSSELQPCLLLSAAWVWLSCSASRKNVSNAERSIEPEHGPNIYKDTKPQMSAFLKNWPAKGTWLRYIYWGPFLTYMQRWVLL